MPRGVVVGDGGGTSATVKLEDFFKTLGGIEPATFKNWVRQGFGQKFGPSRVGPTGPFRSNLRLTLTLSFSHIYCLNTAF